MFSGVKFAYIKMTWAQILYSDIRCYRRAYGVLSHPFRRLYSTQAVSRFSGNRNIHKFGTIFSLREHNISKHKNAHVLQCIKYETRTAKTIT